ncbi:hypothetical protein C3942_05155 [Solimonas fluminis]|uniref:CD-NTase-associated protein 12/Pycsar effector protein TIR domain-containing protein n=1 Tax=Solimonas fluminis TaxID=2086571 RepID=A0A2S5TJC7_9GAMM|nr:TIR domain-containing protein [Solimonas fluminis]PPE75065.1 hypothetical protein C3942_05155 [Solimonas fluminis]
MRKQHNYKAKFPAEVISAALKDFKSKCPKPPVTITLEVKEGPTTWQFASEEEFLAEYRKDACIQASMHIGFDGPSFQLFFFQAISIVSISFDSRPPIEDIHAIFANWLDRNSPVPQEKESKEGLVVFLGHGRSSQWRDLKDHLQDKHGIEVEAYEIGSRAGHTIRDVLESMLDRSDLAFLILTAEDELSSGKVLARQNVVHEVGLFQGKLGFSRAIVVLEEGCEEFSNIAGVQQIRFSQGRIRETFGEVLAVIHRES